MLTTIYFVAILVYFIGYLVAQLHAAAGRVISLAGAALFVLVWVLGALKVVY